MDKVCKDMVTGGQKTAKKHSLGYYIGTMVLISLISLRRVLKTNRVFKAKRLISFRLLFFVTVSCHSLKGISVFTPLPMGEGLFFVITYSVHYVIMASASFCLSFWITLCKLFLSYYHFVDNCLNRGGEISSLFVSHV